MKKAEFLKLQGTDSEVLFVDIRESEELEQSEPLPNSQHIPMGRMFTEAVKGGLPTDVKIVVFCRSGLRAQIVARELGARGFDIEGLEGGLNALRE